MDYDNYDNYNFMKRIEVEKKYLTEANKNIERHKNKIIKLEQSVNKKVVIVNALSILSGIVLSYILSKYVDASTLSASRYLFNPVLELAIPISMVPFIFTYMLWGSNAISKNKELKKEIEMEKIILENAEYMFKTKKDKLNDLIVKKIKNEERLNRKRELLSLKRELLGGAHIDIKSINEEKQEENVKTKKLVRK